MNEGVGGGAKDAAGGTPTQVGHDGDADFDKRLDAANESAAYAGSASLTFLATLLYTSLTAGSTSPESIVLKRDLVLPLLSVGVPFIAFYLLTPILLITFHFFVLFHEFLLIYKLEKLDDHRSDETLLIGPSISAVFWLTGRFRFSLRPLLGLLLAATYVVLPTLTLAFLQYKLLPYRSAALTRSHRFFCMLDLSLLWFFLLLALAHLQKRWGVWLRLAGLALWTIVLTMTSNCVLVLNPSNRMADFVEGLWPQSIHRTLDLRGKVLLREEPSSSGGPDAWRTAKGVDLSERDLVGADLSGSTMYKVRLQGAHLYKATLRDAHLEGADLRRADLREADLEGAFLREALLDGSHLDGARLAGADLTGAKLTHASLSGLDCFRCKLILADLARANLVGARFLGADLSGASLVGADAGWSVFTEARLVACDLTNGEFFGADMRFAQFQEAVGLAVRGLDLRGAEVAGANLCGSKPASAEHDDLPTRVGGERTLTPTLLDFRQLNKEIRVGVGECQKLERVARELGRTLVGERGLKSCDGFGGRSTCLFNSMGLATLRFSAVGGFQPTKLLIVYGPRDVDNQVLPFPPKSMAGVGEMQVGLAHEFLLRACSDRLAAEALQWRLDGSLRPQNPELVENLQTVWHYDRDKFSSCALSSEVDRAINMASRN